MNIGLFFSKRYFLFKRSAHIVNLISWISIISIAVCVAGLIIIASVFNGFDDIIRKMYNNYDSDLKIYASSGKTFILDTSLKKYLNDNKTNFIYSKTIEIDAVIKQENIQFVLKLKGIDNNFANKNFEKKFLLAGEYLYPKNYDRNFILLSTSVSESFTNTYSQKSSDVAVYSLPIHTQSHNLEKEMNLNYFYVLGNFSVHKDVDNKYCFTSLEKIIPLSGVAENEFSSIEIYIDSLSNKSVKQIQDELKAINNKQNLIIEDYLQQNKILYNTMQTEKVSIFLILTFIIMIAAFNLAAMVNLLIMEKQAQIFMLRSFGYTQKKIKQIFIYSGMLYGMFGLFIGLILGTIICLIQIKFHLLKIGSNSFIINYFPVKFNPIDFLLTIIIVFIISFLSTQYAIYKLNKQLRGANFINIF